MSLNVSAEVEARILANAQQAGVSIEDYLEQVLGESEEVAADVRRLETSRRSLSLEEIQGKISRGLAQLDCGEYTSGEEFMADLYSGLDEGKRGPGGAGTSSLWRRSKTCARFAIISQRKVVPETRAT